MKLSAFLLLALAISAFGTTPPRVPLTRTTDPAPYFLQTYLGDPDRLDLKGYPYVVMGSFRDGHEDELPMAVALHTSNTFLAHCRYFKDFNCDLYPENCLTFPSMPFQLDYPFFSISGVMMDLKFSIANYVKTRPASVHYATSCSGSRFHTDQVVGVVGLSIDDNNYNNIETQDQRYSIFLTADDSGGELIFGQDLTHAVDVNKNVTIQAKNYDWELMLSQISFGSRSHSVVNTAIFDMVAPFIGIPANMYLQILEELESTYLLRCQRGVVMPECIYPDDIDLLPNLTLSLFPCLPHTRNVNLPPRLYLKEIRENRFQLLLAGLAIDPHTDGLIHITPSYVNYTILGHPFMKHFYIVFNYQNLAVPTVSLYESKQALPDSGSSTGSGIAIGAILLGVLVIGALAACMWAVNRSRVKANEEARKDMVYGHPPATRQFVVDKPLVTEIKEPLVRPVTTTTTTYPADY
jgi:hypothetical protein